MGEKQVVTKEPKGDIFKVQYLLHSENISQFYSINLEGFFICLFVCLIQKILVLDREKVEKNYMFFLHVDQRAEGESSAHMSGVMVMN